MNVAYKHLPHYTYEDYLNWEGQWELIDGIPYAMSPAPAPRHQWVATNFGGELRTALKKSSCHCRVYMPIDYKLAEDTIFNPDISVVCKPITKQFLDFTPEIVVEILSDSTGMKDRNVKYPKYEAERIPYYIIVDAEKNLVEVYHLTDDHYQRQPVDQSKLYKFVLKDCSFDFVFDDIWE